MKELIYNYDFLSEKDITEVVSRAKAIIINDDFLYYGNQNGVLQFIGGHKKENEKNKIIARDMILVLDEYFSRYHED